MGPCPWDTYGPIQRKYWHDLFLHLLLQCHMCKPAKNYCYIFYFFFLSSFSWFWTINNGVKLANYNSLLQALICKKYLSIGNSFKSKFIFHKIIKTDFTVPFLLLFYLYNYLHYLIWERKCGHRSKMPWRE